MDNERYQLLQIKIQKNTKKLKGKKQMKGLLNMLIEASVLWLAVAVTGCVTIESPGLTIQPVAQYSLHQVKDDLFVAVEPFRDKAKVLKYFGTDLLSDGILPILTVVENHSRTSSFVLLKEQFSLTRLCLKTRSLGIFVS